LVPFRRDLQNWIYQRRCAHSRRLDNVSQLGLNVWPSSSSHQVKVAEMGWACWRHGEEEQCMQVFWWEKTWRKEITRKSWSRLEGRMVLA